MSKFIVGLFNLTFWETLFASCFFFGLIFFIFIIIGAVGEGEDSEIDEMEMDPDLDTDLDGIPDDAIPIDLDGDGLADGWDLDGDGIPDVDADGFALDSEFAIEMDGDISDIDGDYIDIDGDGIPDGLDLDGDGIPDVDMEGVPLELDMDSDFDIEDFEQIEFDNSFEIDPDHNKAIEYKSNYKMGNISTFLLFFGQIGWIHISNLEDIHLLWAILAGFIAMKIFSWIIANYAKTVIVPIQDIQRGDIGVVVYGISPVKPGLVQVERKDGVISTIIAKGAFGYDIFDKGEKGYIWGLDSEIYLLTKGIIGQPDLLPNSSESEPNKKALDT